jgi:hypothetical protein
MDCTEQAGAAAVEFWQAWLEGLSQEDYELVIRQWIRRKLKEPGGEAEIMEWIAQLPDE